MGFLLDTNILSELRKGTRCHERVWRWRQRVALEEIFISVLVVGEVRQGIEKLRPKDPRTAGHLEKWLHDVENIYAERILPITIGICDQWGRISPQTPLPAIDALLAATAIYHRLTLVTRNTRDVARTGAACLNPFTS